MPESLRAAWRFFYFACATSIHIIGFFLFITVGKSKQEAGARLRRRWLSHVPAAMGFEVRVSGTPLQGPCLYVANHIGYIDPFLLLMNVDGSIVAKAEVFRWPVIGYAGHLVGTIFVNRNEKESRQKTLLTIRSALESGKSIIVFPEGTTTDGKHTLPFRPRSFEAAQQAGVPVQPVAISYADPAVPFIGTHTFIPHFFRLFRSKKILCNIAFGPELKGNNTAEASREWIEQMISPIAFQKAS